MVLIISTSPLHHCSMFFLCSILGQSIDGDSIYWSIFFHWPTGWLFLIRSTSWPISNHVGWSVGDHELLKDLIISWSSDMLTFLSQLINPRSINLLVKNIFSSRRASDSDHSDRPFVCFNNCVTGPPHSSLSLIVAQLIENLEAQLKFNFLIDNPQRRPCGAPFCRLLIETRNSSTTEWYTCLNNQNWSFISLTIMDLSYREKWLMCPLHNFIRFRWGRGLIKNIHSKLFWNIFFHDISSGGQAPTSASAQNSLQKAIFANFGED